MVKRLYRASFPRASLVVGPGLMTRAYIYVYASVELKVRKFINSTIYFSCPDDVLDRIRIRANLRKQLACNQIIVAFSRVKLHVFFLDTCTILFFTHHQNQIIGIINVAHHKSLGREQVKMWAYTIEPQSAHIIVSCHIVGQEIKQFTK